MSQESVLNQESSSCLLLSYKRDTYILKLGEELKQLMKNDIAQLLKQEGVVYRHLTLPLRNNTMNQMRQYGGFNKREPGIQRQIVTKDDGPVKRYTQHVTSKPTTQEKAVQTDLLQKEHSEESDLKRYILKMQQDLTQMAEKFNSLESKTAKDCEKENDLIGTEIASVASMSQASSIRKVVAPKNWNLCQFCFNALTPVSGRKVAAELRRLTAHYAGQNILLAVVAEPKYFHINVLSIASGRCLGCVLANESGFWHVDTQLKLAEFTTFYISPQAVQSSKEHTHKFDVYFQYIREANKRKRLRDELRNKRAN